LKPMEPIRNLLFDLGNVVIHLDINKTRQAFLDLGVDQATTWFTGGGQAELLSKLETGKISGTEFMSETRQLAGTEISDKAFMQAWNAMLLDVPDNVIRALKSLQGKYKLIALSNINPIHEIGCNALLASKGEEADFASLFEDVYYSHRIGYRKPSDESFRCVIDGSQIHPEETVFFDDLQENLDKATSMGFRTQLVHHDLPERIAEAIQT